MDVIAVNMKEVPDFITFNTSRFFEITGLGCDFLQQDPVAIPREKNEDYLSVEAIVSNMCVVINFAERGVVLIEEYNELHTTDEDQKQFLLLTVKNYTQQHPNRNKTKLLQ